MWASREMLKDNKDAQLFVKTTLRELFLYCIFLFVICYGKNLILCLVLIKFEKQLPYKRHYNPLMIWNRSWFETALDYKPQILRLRKASYNTNCSAVQTPAFKRFKNSSLFFPLFSLFKQKNKNYSLQYHNIMFVQIYWWYKKQKSRIDQRELKF